MKKTLHTMLTAAVFAAANASAVPTMASGEAGDHNAFDPVKVRESENDVPAVSYGFDGIFTNEYINGGLSYGESGEKAPQTNIVTTTNQYITTITETTTTAWPTPLYGPISTVTKVTTQQDLITLTTTAAQILYGPVMRRDQFGDVNLDNELNIFDVVALRKMLVNGVGEEYSYEEFTASNNADVNQDGVVSIADLILLQRYLLGKIDSLDLPSWTLMQNKSIEKLTDADDNSDLTTTTTAYKPVEDIVISLYGVRPTTDVIEKAVFDTQEAAKEQMQNNEEK